MSCLLMLLAIQGGVVAQEDTGFEPPAQTLDRITVRGSYIPDTVRDTSEISSLISRDDLSIQGDSDAAGALARLSGVSIGSGRFVYLRGLNERYSLVTINGARLPSPEPLKKAVPLDLFPASLIETIMVRKTYSPRVSAQLAGGSVDIVTRAFADGDDFLHLRLSGAYDDAASLRTAPTQIGLELADLTGMVPVLRGVPGQLQDVFDSGRFGQLSVGERNALSRLAVDDKAPVLLAGRSGNDLDWGVRASFGRGFETGDTISAGVSGFVSYSSSRNSRTGTSGIGQADLIANGPVTALSNFSFDSNSHRIKVDASLSGGVEFGTGNSLRLVGLVSRATDIQVGIWSGFTNDDPDIRRERMEWTGRQLWAAQLLGEHSPNIAGALLDIGWRLTVAEARRDAPYGVFNEYETIDGVSLLRSGSGLSFSGIGDWQTEAAVDLTIPVSVGDLLVDIEAGASYNTARRTSSSHTLVAQNIPAAARSLRVDHAYWNALNDPFWSFASARSARSPAFYRGVRDELAGYLRLESELGSVFRAAAGVRYESFVQSVHTAVGSLSPSLSTPGVRQEDLFPAVSLTWTAIDNGQLRLGWSRTVARPQFRELGPNRFTDPGTGEQFSGNPFLRSAYIDSFDARFEYYFDLGQFIAIGAFHKDLRDPIETFNVGSGESRLVTFVNIDRAEVQGIEFEFSRTLAMDRLSSARWFQERDFRARINLTLLRSSIGSDSPVVFLGQSASARLADRVSRLDMDTEVSFEDLRALGALDERIAEFTSGRMLQGQSDILANLQLGYFNAGTGERFNILFNYVGERIRAVESITDDSPSIVEQFPVSLDLVWSRPVSVGGRSLRLSARATNILGGSYRSVQRSGGTQVDVMSYELGRSLSFALELVL